jgi:hypothetical protein
MKNRGYMLMECLVYIGLVSVVLGAGYAALYHCIDNALVLRRNADDIAAALQAGERWRADFRQATGPSHQETSSEGDTLFLQGQRGEIAYRFSGHALLRRVGDGVWTTLLERVRSSTMTREGRPNVTAWRWELELQPRTKGSIKESRVRPLFSFLAVPASGSAQ